jgi:guanylate kinase
MEGRALLFVGPDGSGRNTLADAIGVTLHIPRVISYTTRPKRDHETDDKEYHFISEELFKKMERRGEFIEVVQADGIFYGIKKEDCEELLEEAGSFFAIVSPEGYEIFKEHFDKHLSIFVYADKDTVTERQKKRGDDADVIARHLSHYEEIMAYKDKCDISLPNYDLASTAQELTKRIEDFLNVEYHPDSRF